MMIKKIIQSAPPRPLRHEPRKERKEFLVKNRRRTAVTKEIRTSGAREVEARRRKNPRRIVEGKVFVQTSLSEFP